MTISLKAAADGLSGTIQIGGVDKLTVTQTAIVPASGVTLAGNGPAFIATRSTAQGLSATYSQMVFPTVEKNEGGYYNSTTGAFTPLIAGYYLVAWELQMDGNVLGITSYMEKSGSPVLFSCSSPAAAGQIVTASGLVYLNGTTDFIIINAKSTASAATSGNSASNRFSAVLVRAA